VRLWQKNILDKTCEKILWRVNLMDKEKSDAYKKLVAEVQNKYPHFDKNSDAVLFAPVIDGENICKEINLYTYWQGLDYAKNTPKIKYLFVLQDYGCIFDNVDNLDNFRKINAGFKDLPYISKKTNSTATDENLIKLFEVLGYDLYKRHADLFFTNFCLGYRRSLKTEMTRELMEQDSAEFKTLCEILEPEKIIAMGRKTFECVYKSLTGEDNAELLKRKYWNDFLENHKNISVRIKGNAVPIIPVAHCGTHGIENRNWKMDKNSLSPQYRDWREFKKSAEIYSYKTVDEALENRGATFSEFLFQLIAEKGLKNSQVYGKNDLYSNKKMFSDIRKNTIPKKNNVIKIIFALQLSLEEAKKLLEMAGYALMPSSDFDLIVTHFIATRNFNINAINEELYNRNLPCLF